MSSAPPFSQSRRRIALAIAAVSCVCAFAPSLAHAADLCVKDAACIQAGNANYGTLEGALAAADAAPSADRIFVGPGSYAAPTTNGFSAPQYPVEIIGSGAGSTGLTGPTNTSTVLTLGHPSSAVSNLLIVVPDANDGFPKTGLKMTGGTAKGLSITAVQGLPNATTGAELEGTLFEDSKVTLPLTGPKAAIQAGTDSRIFNVDVTAGQGLDLFGYDIQVDRARVTASGIAVWATHINTRITNSLVHLTGPGTGIFASTGLSNADVGLTARNVTIVGEGGVSTGIASTSGVAHTATVLVDSTIVRGVKYPFSRSASAPGTANLGIVYSDYDPSAVVSGGPGGLGAGLGNIDSDPLLAGPLDFHPLAGSPVIDAGDPGTFNDSLDLDGNPRVVGGRRDMGAFEIQPQPPTPTDQTQPAPGGISPDRRPHRQVLPSPQQARRPRPRTRSPRASPA